MCRFAFNSFQAPDIPKLLRKFLARYERSLQFALWLFLSHLLISIPGAQSISVTDREAVVIFKGVLLSKNAVTYMGQLQYLGSLSILATRL